MIIKDFPGLPQRGVYYFLATSPPFYPVQSPDATAEQQEAAYLFIKRIYQRLYDEPSLLGLKPAGDDAYGDWEPYKDRPKLAPKIRGIIQKAAEFIAVIQQIASEGRYDGGGFKMRDAEFKPAVIKRLELFGVTVKSESGLYEFILPGGAAEGLKLLAKNADGNKVLFSRAVFDAEAPWLREVYGNMLDNRGPFDRLIDFFDANGYLRVEGRNDGSPLPHAIMNYIKNYTDSDEPLKWGWSERTRGGMEFLYEEARKNPALFTLRVPYFKGLLNHSDKMSPDVKAFIQRTAKKCDNCRYCVQTDKTGKRPLAFVKVEQYAICPLYCGFQFNWRELSAETVDNIIGMLTFIDEIYRPGGPGEAELKKWAK